ncbi:MAG: hypothetical protein JNL01_03510 [Bdellovibrionales bacterium]|nr:hypothetical protein [Bdellovibrionales bacterium]
MKKLFLIALMGIMAGSSAFAAKVGDSATYAITGYQGLDGVVNTVTAIDATTGDYTVDSTYLLTGGQTQKETGTVPASAIILDDNLLSQIAALCGAAGGTVEQITVKAGTFDTCKLENADINGYTWLGDVSFGIVKSEGTDTNSGAAFTMELTSFVRN